MVDEIITVGLICCRKNITGFHSGFRIHKKAFYVQLLLVSASCFPIPLACYLELLY